MYWKFTKKNQYGDEVTKEAKIIEMTVGDIFGEESLVFERPSTCWIVVKSVSMSCFVVEPKLFEQKLRSIMPFYHELCWKKFEFFDMVWQKVIKVEDVKESIQVPKRISVD